jgi:hypothetical protein
MGATKIIGTIEDVSRVVGIPREQLQNKTYRDALNRCRSRHNRRLYVIEKVKLIFKETQE